jgi:hypothetical protein
VIICRLTAGEGLIHSIITSQNSSPVQEHLKSSWFGHVRYIADLHDELKSKELPLIDGDIETTFMKASRSTFQEFEVSRHIRNENNLRKKRPHFFGHAIVKSAEKINIRASNNRDRFMDMMEF